MASRLLKIGSTLVAKFDDLLHGRASLSQLNTKISTEIDGKLQIRDFNCDTSTLILNINIKYIINIKLLNIKLNYNVGICQQLSCRELTIPTFKAYTATTNAVS